MRTRFTDFTFCADNQNPIRPIQLSDRLINLIVITCLAKIISRYFSLQICLWLLSCREGVWCVSCHAIGRCPITLPPTDCISCFSEFLPGIFMKSMLELLLCKSSLLVITYSLYFSLLVVKTFTIIFLNRRLSGFIAIFPRVFWIHRLVWQTIEVAFMGCFRHSVWGFFVNWSLSYILYRPH